ncbi:hypothetical protein [Herpetosiphon llansteffanensis]|uniref:hypothetical protein n=1 Tax=Herpetosiphon llansteffanensis TaxID=2094568 RepID=UPI000D7CC6F1|nr:hypothetical protein [Herpetosiphon llansteffanensis]
MCYQDYQNSHERIEQLYNLLTAKPERCANYHDLLLQAAQLKANELNIDQNHRFTVLFEHLNLCLDCAVEYGEVVEMLRAYANASQQVELQKQRTFFTKPDPTAERKDPKKWLKLWQAAKRQLELHLPTINLQPMLPTMATTALYNSQLTEFTGKPFFVVALIDTQSLPVFKVTLREPQPKQWQVIVQTSKQCYSQTTNAQGTAEFTTIPAAELSQGIVLTCAEL